MEWIRATKRLYLSMLALFALMQYCSGLQAANLECPASVSNGQPACSVSRDVGSNPPDSATSAHVGNPIDVVSGNKYQSEVDIKLGNSHLSLVRHYNSSNTAQNIGLGNGWRHTYSVGLASDGDDVRRIEQSDGRVIVFRRRGDQFIPANEADGRLIETSSDRYVWQLPDGRSFAFFGSFLTKISFADGGSLNLFYKEARLYSVTDELGRSLVFQYAPGGVGLPAYEGINGSAASGHLVRVMLADGEQVSFNYSKIQNLVSVEYPLGAQGNTGRRYGYQDPLNTSLLTERSDSRGKVFARWKYDELGRAISYRSGSSIRADGSQAGPPNLTLEYSNSDDSDKGETRVVFSNGSTQIYSWRQDETGHIFELVKNAIEVSKGREVEIDRLPNGSNEASDRVQYYPHDVLMVLAVDSLGYPSTIQLTLRRDGSTHILESKYDQVGRLVDVNWQSGMLEDYNVGQTTTIAELRVAFEQIRATGTNQQVLFSALAQKAFMQGTVHEFLGEAGNQLEVGSTITGEELDEARRKESLNGDGSSSQRSSKSDDDADSIPCENPLEDCAALLRVRDYAEVAECAYVDADCDTRFVEANLDDLSIGLEDLHEGSFHAEIFYDKARDEYIVSFAGTDLTSGGDWWNNLEQELGFSSFQYKKAVLLAKRLVENSPDVNFQFVGHSLGGGLATAAASSVGGEATVFNPAALDEESAIGLGVDYGQAQSNTQIYSVVGEILSQAQTDISFMGLPPGTVNSLPKPEFSWIQENLSQNPYSFYQGRLGVLLHLMDSVQQSLSELITRNQCV